MMLQCIHLGAMRLQFRSAQAQAECCDGVLPNTQIQIINVLGCRKMALLATSSVGCSQNKKDMN